MKAPLYIESNLSSTVKPEWTRMFLTEKDFSKGTMLNDCVVAN